MSGLIISLVLSLGMLQPSHYFKYVDGNNNTYTIENSKLTYTPVKKENSSSGNYDGGEDKVVDLSADEKEKAEGLFIEAVNTLSCHIDKREMGCGTITISSQSGITKMYIEMNSDEKKNLDTYLKSLLK